MGRFLVASGVVAACMVWFKINDSKLPVGAQRLEFTCQPHRAAEIAEQYTTDEHRARVTRALVVDSAIFVPAYVVALSAGAGRKWTAAIAAAGLLDLVENGGIALEVHQKRYDLAPVVGTAAAIKWAIVLAAIGRSIVRYARR
ncbi:MAG TPA: hypothetical protein VGF48_22430 [Thermoanaerobaculia bacterium]|jgi:hypothetical protein